MQQFIDGLKKGRVNDDVAVGHLSSFEQKLVTELHRIELKGKRQRCVAALLTNEMVANLQVQLNLRNKYVDSSNNFLFARPGKCETPYRGSDCLREHAVSAQTEHPETLTSTNLRKHLATCSQVLNISENQQDILADFMGHDIRVHRNFYRLPLGLVQKTQVSQILMAINGGKTSMYKSIEEVEYKQGRLANSSFIAITFMHKFISSQIQYK